jgi:lipoate-protein ligase A
MHLIRGKLPAAVSDRDVTDGMLADVAASSEPVVRVWRPPRQVVFGPRDVATDGYGDAKAAAHEHGFRTRERSVGGHAVAYTGNTVAFARVVPVEDERQSITERYEQAVAQLTAALRELGVEPEPREPPGAFCPGSHSLSANGKLAGIAQRIRGGAALTAGIVVTRDHDAIGRVLSPVYAALSIEFRSTAIGSLRRAGGTDTPERVVQAVEEALADGHETTKKNLRHYIGE